MIYSMSTLSPRGRALVHAGRRALQPTDADRVRLLGALSFRLALLMEIRTEPARCEGPDRNERRGRILDVFDRGVRQRAGAAAARATGEFQSVVLGSLRCRPTWDRCRPRPLRSGRACRWLAARGESRTEPFGVDSGRMQGAAKRRILEVFKRAATQQPVPKTPERRRGDFCHGLLGLASASSAKPHGLHGSQVRNGPIRKR